MIIIFFIILIGGVGFLALMYKGGKSVVALSKPAIQCPVCGRDIHVVGKIASCYKCNSKLIQHANGNYIKG